MWGRRKKVEKVWQIPNSPTNYPSGLVVKTEKATYLIKGSNKFKMYSDRVVASWNSRVIESSEIAISQFKRGGTLGFREGTLIKNIADGKIYLISENKRRHITNPDVFVRYGLDEDCIISVSAAETNLHEEGKVLE